MFIGQDHIWNELAYIIPRLKEGENINLLLRAPSGYGKTKMGVMITNLVDGLNSQYHVPDDAGNVNINSKYRIQLIDECHMLKNPEALYPLMDSNKYTFIFMSNEAGELKEPLIRRCIQFIFRDYNDGEMSQILTMLFREKGINLPREYLPTLLNNINRNPASAVMLVRRLYFIFTVEGFPTVERLKEIIEDILEIKDGLTELHTKYMKFLTLMKRASLNTMVFSTKIDKATILRDVEPVLLYKGLIKITARGREII